MVGDKNKTKIDKHSVKIGSTLVVTEVDQYDQKGKHFFFFLYIIVVISLRRPHMGHYPKNSTGHVKKVFF